MTERTVCLIQARQGSSRLHGKSLRILQGRPLIGHVVERAQAIVGVDDVVLATTDKPADDALADYVRTLGVGVFRGSEYHVLERLFFAATLARATVVMRLTGDCPFLCPELAMTVLALYRRARQQTAHPAYAWNDTTHSGYPDGTDVEVFCYRALVDAMLSATSPHDIEHVTPWIRANYYAVAAMSPDADASHIKLSVDTPDDFERARLIASRLCPRQYALSSTLRAYKEALCRT
jgi:spore coat polysaccharide biosynthesis protein SpsF (cytidylyltransferase family)